MRIDATTIGLAAYLAGVARAAASSGLETNQYIIFNTDDWGTAKIFQNGTQIAWTVQDDNITISRAYLVKHDDNHTAVAKTEQSNMKRNSLGERDLAGSEQSSHLATRDPDIGSTASIPFDLNAYNLSGNAGFITVDYTHQKENYDERSAAMTPLYLQIDWWFANDRTTRGSSYSPIFAISDGTAPSNTLITQLEAAFTGSSYNPAYGECATGWSCGTSSSGSQTTTSLPTAATSGPTGTNSATASTEPSGSNESSSSTGLSTGALVGIVVACVVVGLAAIGAAIWFFCLRRRRSSQHAALAQNGGYGSDGIRGAIMADKELPHVTDSPRSTYAADRSQLHDPHEVSRNSIGGAPVGAGTGLMNGTAHAAHGSEDTAYAPYSDHTPPAGALGTPTGPMSSQSSLPVGGVRSPTPPISNRYAHLVEEGMTDAEIRRLDEEERALDMAIEDAGRSSRAQ